MATDNLRVFKVDDKIDLTSPYKIGLWTPASKSFAMTIKMPVLGHRSRPTKSDYLGMELRNLSLMD